MPYATYEPFVVNAPADVGICNLQNKRETWVKSTIPNPKSRNPKSKNRTSYVVRRKSHIAPCPGGEGAAPARLSISERTTELAPEVARHPRSLPFATFMPSAVFSPSPPKKNAGYLDEVPGISLKISAPMLEAVI